MQERYSPLLSSLAIGLLHGLWHLPVYFLVNGPVAAGPFQLLPFLRNVLAAAALTITFTWVYGFYFVFALVLVVFTRGRLGYQPTQAAGEVIASAHAARSS